MALTRKFLKAMGIEEDKIEEIIEAHLETVTPLKEYKGKVEDAESKVKELTEKLEAIGDDGYKSKFEALATEFEKFKTDVANKETALSIENAYKKLLKDSGIKDDRIAETICKATKFEGFKVLDDGTLENADNLSAEIKSNWGAFIPTEKEVGAETSNPPSNTDAQNPNLDSMSMAEYLKYRKGK